MRITQEADYAIRIIFYLALKGKKTGAKQIAEATGVSLRFALKILRKLIFAEIVKSYKGINGGYELIKEPNKISLGEIIELIDGPIAINHCLKEDFNCTRVSNKNACAFHLAFDSVNQMIRQELYKIRMDQFIQQ